MYRGSLFVPFLLICILQSSWVFAGEFLQTPSYPGGAGTLAMATGDVNGDGHVDLVLANSVSHTVGIILGNADASFQPPVDLNAGRRVDYVALGDFNRDGKLDVVSVAGIDSQVNLLLGNGDGTFQSPVPYTTGSLPRSVTVADVNGDGNLDVVTANDTGFISVLLGNGNGGLGTHKEFKAGDRLNLAAVGDFNGDQKADILVDSVIANGIGLVLGNGDGTFQPPQRISNLHSPGAIVLTDFNQDGKLDFAATLGVVEVFLGNGDGTFHSPVAYDSVTSNGLALGDLNGDGKLDLVGVGFSTSVLLGNGDGTFRSPLYSQTGNSFVAVADLNGDGKADVVGTQNLAPTGTINVLIGLGNGTFVANRDFNAGFSGGAPGVGDFNGDGKVDFAAASYANNTDDLLSILPGNGDGTLAATPLQFTTGHLPVDLGVADLNGDGRLDIAVATFSGVSIHLGKGDGTFNPHVDYDNGGNQLSAMALGDFNHDGKPDIAAADIERNAVDVFLNNGDGTFQPQVTYSVATYPDHIQAGDFNSDGKLDLIVNNTQGGSLSLLLGNGDGTFQAQTVIPTGSGSSPSNLAAADLNHDGKLDLAMRTNCANHNQCFFQFSVLIGHGDGTFSAPVNFPLGGEEEELAIGDLNGDGNLDLLAGSYDEVGVLVGNGDGTFQPEVTYDANGFALTLADFNGDGALDVASGGGFFDMLLNTGGTKFDSKASPNPAQAGQPVTFAVSVRATVVGQPLPGGTVTWKEGATVLATRTLSQGRTRFVTSGLGLGTHVIKAFYSGDNNFLAKIAKPIALVVNP